MRQVLKMIITKYEKTGELGVMPGSRRKGLKMKLLKELQFLWSK